ncbi:hypothetical protein BDZ89DRAFT_1052679 [Hymenopellis radicata]|nr:hypothetical protein BDZ89DRAFT_1052679 [Hymenopellis radicata]
MQRCAPLHPWTGSATANAEGIIASHNGPQIQRRAIRIVNTPVVILLTRIRRRSDDDDRRRPRQTVGPLRARPTLSRALWAHGWEVVSTRRLTRTPRRRCKSFILAAILLRHVLVGFCSNEATCASNNWYTLTTTTSSTMTVALNLDDNCCLEPRLDNDCLLDDDHFDDDHFDDDRFDDECLEP